MARVTIDLPPEVLSTLRRTPAEFVGEMRTAAAIYWYQRGELSQEKAAAVAGMTRVAFLELLAARRVDVVHVDADDLRQELDRG